MTAPETFDGAGSGADEADYQRRVRYNRIAETIVRQYPNAYLLDARQFVRDAENFDAAKVNEEAAKILLALMGITQDEPEKIVESEKITEPEKTAEPEKISEPPEKIAEPREKIRLSFDMTQSHSIIIHNIFKIIDARLRGGNHKAELLDIHMALDGAVISLERGESSLSIEFSPEEFENLAEVIGK